MFDYSPLYRSSVGFDRLFRLLDEAANVENQAWPPYNIERLGENDYRITIAVAGFAAGDISIEAKGNTLTVAGKKAEKPIRALKSCIRASPAAASSAASSSPTTSR